LLAAKKVRLGYYHSQKARVAEYGLGEDHGCDGIVDENIGVVKTESKVKEKIWALEAMKGEVFETTPQAFCVKIAD